MLTFLAKSAHEEMYLFIFFLQLITNLLPKIRLENSWMYVVLLLILLEK